METVIATVADCCGLSPATFQERRRGDESRDVATCLTRRLTTATLREVAGLFGLSHLGSVSNLLRRAERTVAESSRLRRVIEVIEQRLMKTKNEVCPCSSSLRASLLLRLACWEPTTGPPVRRYWLHPYFELHRQSPCRDPFGQITLPSQRFPDPARPEQENERTEAGSTDRTASSSGSGRLMVCQA